ALLKKLPGIGDYTAGAVASIAYGYPAACVDGNVLRVFARLRNDPTDITLPKAKEALDEDISTNMPRDPGSFNQALMELGALVCLPNGQPLCQSCPLAHLCQSRAAGTQTRLPVKAAKAARQVSRLLVLVLQDSSGRIALRRRTLGPLKGMWELPTILLEGEVTPEKAAQAAAELGFEVAPVKPLGSAKHDFTHREWQMEGWLLQSEGDFAPPPEGWVYALPRQLKEEYALPAAFRAYRVWEE
ncbi:MAG: NUDIX domain-containing protein, partial [Oscillospiraceae bacterium]|nr:NUDIX domain-containing protein [Oscillospiraceae bacterium]